MKTLDEQIDDIEKLDKLRQQARKLQQEAIEVLTAAPYRPKPPPGTPETDEAAIAWKSCKRDDWEMPGDQVEYAQVLRALGIAKAKESQNSDTQKESVTALLEQLRSIQYGELSPASHAAATPPIEAPDHIPVLRAAYVLQALAERPGDAFSVAAAACFGRIAQELNEIVDPTWAAGAARADEKSLATAFVTGECARALLAMETALQQTADAAKLLGKEAARDLELASENDVWSEQQKKLQQTSLSVSLAALPRVIVEVLRNDDGLLLKPPGDLLRDIELAMANFPGAAAVMGPRPHAPAGPIEPKRMRAIVSDNLAYAASVVAWDALDQLHKKLTDAATDIDLAKRGKKTAKKLEYGAQVLRDLLSQIEPFAESCIDRQIAAASPYLSVPVDGAELVFAATLFGALSDWRRPKVRAAYDVLYPLLSSNGRLLSLRPFEMGPDGYRLNVATLQVTRHFADLIANLDVEPEPEFVARLMLPFEYTRVSGAPGKSGWTSDPPLREPKSLWWLTAIAAGALGSVVHMLDKTINRRVLRHFHVREPASLTLRLDDLFYPDFGLTAFRGDDRLAKQKQKPQSVAIELQHLRAHAGNGPAEKQALFSLILYGPPGTGKTTLVEAAAASAGVPLVEITPSDILVGGTEGIERRARQVFQALSKLTHVVILFDEFEQILLDRKMQGGKMPTSVIEFLTPGMLPKLKALYDASKTGRVSYVLATNYLDTIDSAVRRNGRFDRRCAIYPPDVISRLGRLRDQVNGFRNKRKEEYLEKRQELQLRLADPAKKAAAEAELRDLQGKIEANDAIGTDGAVRQRIMKAVKRTSGGPMSSLGQPGCFTQLDEDKASGKLFGYVLNGSKDFDEIEAEADFEKEKAGYPAKNKLSNDGKRYWDDWKAIRKWDKKFTPPASAAVEWKELVVQADKLVKQPPKPAGAAKRRGAA